MHRVIALTTAVLFVLLTYSAAAQEEMHEDVRAFFEDSSPALLFEVHDFTLERYADGIGIMFSGGNIMQWRISISPEWREEQSDFYSPDESLTETREDQEWSIGGMVAPVWILGSFDRFVMQAGPLAGYSYRNDHTDRRRDEQTDHWEATTNWLHFGATLGVGFVPASRVMITAEYQIIGSWKFFEYDQSSGSGIWDRDYTDFMSKAVLTLAVRL